MSNVPVKESVAALRERLLSQVSAARTGSDVQMLQREWLGKDGAVKGLFKVLKDVPAEEKSEIAAAINSLRDLAESELARVTQAIEAAELKKKVGEQFIDLSLPSNSPGVGRVHPITVVEEQIAAILRPFGFENVYGPEVETEYYCFDSLNIPKHHPARDMQDTFFTETGHVLRTHTTSVQARVLEERSKLPEAQRLPIKVASFGRVYRNETEDASHQAMFHQFELVWVEKGLTLAHLMGLITHILKELYGKKRKVRFVPKFYPYTEPSIGPQIDCTICRGSGCGSCGGAGWVTIAGAGMIHRAVLKEFNFDPESASGFAFGLGTARLAGQMFQLPRLKMLYENDLRILKGVA
jgi:phenylalanyl-tRNA synthetase alpha chain